MARWGLILLGALVVAGVVVWFLQDDTPHIPPVDPIDDATTEDETAPTLEGDAQPETPTVSMATIDDPIDFVAKFGRPLDDTARKTILQLAEDPAFLEALVAWVKDPALPALAPGVSQSNRGWWREQAVHATLEAIGAPAAMRLAQELSDRKEDVRMNVAKAIGAIGPKAEPVVPDLIARIGVDESKYVRADLMDALGKVGPAASDALPLIHAALRDEDTEERFGLACARTLVPIGGATRDVFDTATEVLRADWYEASAIIVKSVAPLGKDAAPLIPVLVTLYDTTLGEDQLWGIVPKTLAAIGVASEDVIVFLRRAYWTSVEEQVYGGDDILLALAQLGPRGKQELLEITASTETPHGRSDAVTLLGQAGADDAELISLLEPALAKGDAYEQLGALQALVAIGLPADHLPWIEPFLEAESSQMRTTALDVLRTMKSPPRRIFDLLEARLADEDSSVAHTAVCVAGEHTKVDPKRALDLIQRALASDHLGIQHGGVSALAFAMHAAPHEASRLAIQALERDPSAFGTAHLLATTGPETQGVIDAVVAMTRHADPQIRQTGLRGLNRFGKKEHFDVVFHATNDAHHGVRADAISYLSKFRRFAPKRVLDRWIEALDDQWVVYARACACLGRLGADAKAAIPKLEALSKKRVPNRYMALAPEQALKRIRVAVGE